ncbi:hypothetical protein UFOVP1169_39 [uncultured Caudovirales phage]|uniref:Uncharacterized protein n=1 Tax=uncultured Caudovirales phage TaxID=2100421 RepID=A0A6J5QTY3_9CAUD|nr:hypothetical protein UFOVP1169_39 [uncultured Caudovirales phage]
MNDNMRERIIKAAVCSMLAAQDKIEPGTGGDIKDLKPSELENIWKVASSAVIGALRQAAREVSNDDWANAVAGCVVSVLADRLEPKL